MTRRELLSNLRILGLAGHETTASTMAWMMLHAASDPEIWEHLCAEANEAEGPPISPKEIRNFPYAEAFFRECLRLYPPVGMLPPRRVLEPIPVGDKVIPPNANARWPKHWRRSSVRRTDTGMGACEVIFVNDMEIVKRGTPGWYALDFLVSLLFWLALISRIGLLLFGLTQRVR